MAIDMVEMLNTIRANASTNYNTRVPEATKDNLSETKAALLGDVELANEFMGMLMNKVAFTLVHNKLFKNPLAILKKGSKPLGDSVEEIFINYAKASAYDAEGSDLLSRKLPDVKAVYHTMNRKDKYKVTVTYEMLSKAFNSYGALNNFVSGIVNSLYNGANLDEFTLMKRLITDAVVKAFCWSEDLDDEVSTSAEGATKFIKAVKLVSTNMQFPSSKYNGYLYCQETDTVPVTTFTALEDQYIIMDSATAVAIDVDVLANAFNMSKMDFLARRIVVDSFMTDSIAVDGLPIAIIMDKDFIQVYDDMIKMTTFKNPEGLYDNYYLHVWQTMAVSPLVNAVAFNLRKE